MLTIRNLSKSLQSGQEVLSKISVQIDEGELIGLVGGSGSGKTTLLKCIALKEKWDEGQFIYQDRDITSLGMIEKFKVKRDWAYVEEKAPLDLKKSAVKNVLQGRFYEKSALRVLTGTHARDEHVLAMDYLEKVGLLDKAEMKAQDLSGGERQRIAIARALVQGAKIVIADEPVSGLDPDSANSVLSDLRDLCKREKVTVIASLHHLEFAEKYASRIWGIKEGRIVLDIAGRRLTSIERNKIFD
ncbi:phosphonate ABC transporter ATP-binding protein [Paenibacillus sp. FJAT-26967]|uniref:phosphonate ABC transporter ATP-binding protein n=1 Tax=Paenibacillus sp. FJAT-26967 TaxID=1729690 RepID=UPI000839A9E9|nr:ATP-binding cassette domain-containing protein [Paenibacillus sp. FJAT-26967]